MMRKVVLWVLTLSVAAGIFMFSGQSAEQSSALSGAVTQGLLSSLFSFFEFTKEQQDTLHELVRSAAHVASFALLGMFASLLARSYTADYWLPIAYFACLAYAIFDEYHQLLFAEGRAFEWFDVFKDGVGILLGVALSLLAYKCEMRIRSRFQKQTEGS